MIKPTQRKTTGNSTANSSHVFETSRSAKKKNLVSTSCAPRIAERMQQTWLKYAEISPIDVDFPNESSIVHG